jgi:hypothetical protein
MIDLATLCKQLHALPMGQEASFDGDSEIEFEEVEQPSVVVTRSS